jgi:hypothetical protein
MTPTISIRTDLRFLIPFLAPFVIGLLLLTFNVESSRATSVAGMTADTHLTTGDLGVARPFVTDATIVTGPNGIAGTGAEGLERYIASLEARYPEARFETTRTHAVNSLIIVDWRATVDGTVVLPGRTLITIEDGTIAEIHFLNLNNVAPVQGGMSVVPTTAAQTWYELPYEQGRPVVVEPDTDLASQD